MYLLGLSSNLWQGINDRGLDLIVGDGGYEQLAHGARTGISWLCAEYAACISVATFGHSFGGSAVKTMELENIFALIGFRCSCQIVVFMLLGNAKAFEVGSCNRLV